MKNKIDKREIYCFTSDNWCPNYEGNKVRVTMCLNNNIKNHYVCVWGEDDLGMEFWSKDKTIIRKLYKKICNLEDVTMHKLKKLGLYRS
jgi:hypothetical protein